MTPSSSKKATVDVNIKIFGSNDFETEMNGPGYHYPQTSSSSIPFETRFWPGVEPGAFLDNAQRAELNVSTLS